MIVQSASSRTGVPWRNGLGVQYEITADGSLPDGWGWRLSTADITTDVAFSSFPGVQRYFCIGTGNGVVLTIDGVEHHCGPGSITEFRGDATVDAALIDGPSCPVNLMVRDGSAHRGYHVSKAGMVSTGLVVVALDGGATVSVEGDTIELASLDAIICEVETSFTVVSGSVVVMS